VNDRIQWKLEQIYAPEAMPAKEFYPHLHAMVTMNDGALENWPRVGLEAMAAGVPIVTENKWGWPEMIEDGVTGLLADDHQGIVEQAKRLERDEPLRLKIAQTAREWLEAYLAEPEGIWRGWCDVFRAVGHDELAGDTTATPHVETIRQGDGDTAPEPNYWQEWHA